MSAIVIMPVENKVQEGVDYNQMKYQPISGMTLANTVEKQGAVEIEKIANENNEIDQKNLTSKNRVKELQLPDKQKDNLRKIILAVVVLVSCGEGFFFYEALRHSWRILPSIIVSIMLAAAVAMGVHIGAKYIKSSSKKVIQAIRTFVILLCGFLLCYFVGVTRANSYNDTPENLHTTSGLQVTEQHAQVNQWGIIMISFVLYVIILFLSFYIARNKKEEEEYAEYLKLKAEIDKGAQKVNENNAKIEEIKNKVNTEKEQAFKKFEYATSYENRLVALAHHLVGVFIQSNVQHRTDGIIPEFYSRKPVFDFKLFYNNFKRRIK